MMKISTYTFSIILTSLLVFNSVRVSITYAFYTIDPEGFIELLCINKDKPEMQCNGQCQLSKVSEEQNEDRQIPENILDFKELVFYDHTATGAYNFLQLDVTKPNDIIYNNLYSFQSLRDCFHPPKS